MNSADLGLTREEIKKEIREVVEEEFAKYLRSDEMQPRLEFMLLNSKRNDVKWKVVERASNLLATKLEERFFKND